MRFLITVEDHAHGGGTLIVRQEVVVANTPENLVSQMVDVMTDYPFCRVALI